MRFAHTNLRSIAQRARRDAERERCQRDRPPQIPHGTQIGRIVVEYHGQRVELPILQAGSKCRTHGVVVDGQTRLMGLYKAAALATSMVSRVPGARSDFWW